MKLDLQTLASELHDALKAAESANQAKTNFLANMSHEMRTPLNAVLGLSELLLESGEVHEECFINLEKINSAGMVLLNMVNDILDISKIEAGKYDITPVEYDVPSLINDAVTQSIMFRNEKPVEFVLSIDGNLPTQLYGDEIRIKQIFNNLLSNAFKYTKEGEVEFGISCDRGEDGTALLIACVKDTGKGIQPEGIKRMFEDYAQLDAYSNREVTGTGLGLPIVRRLLDLMGGSIDVESEYGKGSTFTMRLPQKYVTDAVIGPEMAENLKAFNYHEQKRKWNAKLARIIMPYARVLVVDDVVTNLDVAKGLMKPYGMQIDCVTSGQQAIDAIRDESVVYNAVFMDHMMPCMDGVEATQRIREIGTEYAKSVPIIALTANAIAGNEEMFLDKGFQAFISKPIEIARLDAVVRQWVRDKEQEKLLDFKQITVDGMPVLDTRKGGERRSETERRGVLDRRILGRLYYGLNAKKGMERFGGDKEVYLNVLHSFAKNTKPLLEQARGVTHEALPDYAITVHGIKGSSRGIFAEEIGTKAEALEVAARSDDFDYIIENNQAFIETVERFLVDIEDMLDRINAENAKPKKEKPDKETLANLLAAAEGFDMDGADMAITELMRYEYASEGKLVDWLREMVAEADFAQIAERLAGYAGFGGTNGK